MSEITPIDPALEVKVDVVEAAEKVEVVPEKVETGAVAGGLSDSEEEGSEEDEGPGIAFLIEPVIESEEEEEEVEDDGSEYVDSQDEFDEEVGGDDDDEDFLQDEIVNEPRKRRKVKE